MNNSTKNIFKALIISGASLTFAMTAQSATFAKFDGVDGESKYSSQNSQQSRQSTPLRLKSSSRTQQGLLLPAVQKVREAARSSSSKQVKRSPSRTAGDEHEIEYDVVK